LALLKISFFKKFSFSAVIKTFISPFSEEGFSQGRKTLRLCRAEIPHAPLWKEGGSRFLKKFNTHLLPKYPKAYHIFVQSQGDMFQTDCENTKALKTRKDFNKDFCEKYLFPQFFQQIQ
jgi:hypothetical protein